MNITELLSDYNIDYRTEGHEHCRSGWAQIDCPFCSPDSMRYRMGINIQYNYCNCWHCGHKSLSYILLKILKIPPKKAKIIVGKIRPERIIKPEHTGKYEEPPGTTKMLPPHRRYLKKRGFNPKQIEQFWMARGIGIASKLQWRIFIPIIHHGQAVSWTTRSIGNNPHRKYISASLEEESLPHGQLLYGQDYCRHAVIVCEGPLDVWAIGPGAVATFGLSLTMAQIQEIKNYPTRAICFDNEPEAQNMAKKLVNTLSPFPGDTYNIVLDSKDPGEANHQEIQRIRREILEQ